MQLAITLAILLTFVVAEHGPRGGLGEWSAALVVGAFIFSACLHARVGSRLLAARIAATASPSDVAALEDRFGRWKQWQGLIWLTLSPVVVYCVGWGPVVRSDFGWEGFVLVDEALILLPVILPLLFAWSCFYDVELALHGLREGGAGRCSGESSRRRWRFVGLYARLYLGLILLPLGVLWTAADLGRLAGGSRESASLFLLPGMLLVALLFPLLLRRVWKTSSLPPGDLRSRLEAAARQSGLQLRDILVWNTDGRMLNAAIAGLTRSVRYLLLSDLLLKSLSEPQIEAVLRHEAAHIRRHHLPLRIAVLLAPVWAWAFLAGDYGPWSAEAGWTMDGPADAIPSGWMALTGGWTLPLALGALAYCLAALSVISQFLEFDADLWACRRGDQQAVCPEFAAQLISALQRIADLTGSGGSRSWLHPSLDRRIQRLQQAAADPRVAHRHWRQVRRLRHAVLAVAAAAPLAALAVHGWSLRASWPL